MAHETIDTVPIGNVSGLAANVAAWLADPTSAKLAAALTDESGTGAVVLGSAPTLTNVRLTSSYTLTATGTDQAGALALTNTYNRFTTVASGAGGRIASGANGMMIVINNGANALLLYPATGGTINGGSTNASISIGVGEVWLVNNVNSTTHLAHRLA